LFSVLFITILDIIHRPAFVLGTGCFGDWNLFPFSGGMYVITYAQEKKIYVSIGPDWFECCFVSENVVVCEEFWLPSK
jgi:hypothetical protein